MSSETGKTHRRSARVARIAAPPGKIALHACGMLRHFTLYYRNNQVNTFTNAPRPSSAKANADNA